MDKIELRVVDEAGNMSMFRVKKSTQMSKIKKMYSERFMIPVTTIDFVFDGRKIHDDDTPKGLELEEGDAIKVHYHKDSGDRAPKKPDGWKEDLDKIKFRIVDDVGNMIMFRVKKSIEMGKIKKMYSEKYMIPVTAIDFFFDGRKIQDDDTPKGLELEEGDAIEAGNAPFVFGLPGYTGGLGDDLHREMLNYVLDSWRIPFPDVDQRAMIPKMDSDGSQLLTCPYNPSHKIAKDRIQTHLVKCRRNHPEADLVVCPYNASHRVPRPEEQFHVTSCQDADRRSSPEAKSDGRQEKKPNCIKKAFRAVKKVFCCI